MWQRIIQLPIYFGFTTSETAFNKEVKRLGSKDCTFVQNDADAMCMYFVNTDQASAAIIVSYDRKSSPDKELEVGVLVHEAVHAWDYLVEYIEEKTNPKEIKAYTIQYFVQLMLSWLDECEV